MKKIYTNIVIGSFCLLAQPGIAQITSPGPITINGEVTFSITDSDAWIIDCNISGEGNATTKLIGSITELSMTPSSCEYIVFEELPYSYTITTNSITIHDVQILKIIDDRCAGDLIGNYNRRTGLVTFNNAIVPETETPGQYDCMFNGTMQIDRN